MGLPELQNSYEDIKKETEYDIEKLIHWIRTKYLPGLRNVIELNVVLGTHVNKDSAPMKQALAMEANNATNAWQNLVNDYTSSTKVGNLPDSFREAKTLLDNASKILESMTQKGKNMFKKWEDFGKELSEEVERLKN